MPLPKLVVPEYECELPSTGEKVKYRPFLVKEEKILLMAMESNSEKDMMNAVKSIIRNCTSIKRKIDALPTFDIEFLFLRIRAKSAGEEADVIITAPDDGETEIKIKVPLEEVACEKPEGHNPKIMLDDDTGNRVSYYDEIVSPKMTIYKLEKNGKKDNKWSTSITGRWEIENALPYNISPYQLSSARTQLLKTRISFKVERYRFVRGGAFNLAAEVLGNVSRFDD